MENYNMVPLEELFISVCGIASAYVERSKEPRSENDIPYIRPSHKQYSSIDAFVDKRRIPEDKIFPVHTLYVSTDGQGSHTYAYVSACEFVPNSNITVLLPRREMILTEKLFYAQCITANRYKFSYGRKPKGERLNNIYLPKTVPNEYKEFSVKKVAKRLLTEVCPFEKAVIQDQRESALLVPLEEIFDLHSGILSSEVTKQKEKPNQSWIPYIRPSNRQNTSIDAYVNQNAVPPNKIFPADTLYVSTNGQGSHTFSYVSTSMFVPNSDVTVLIPKRKMSLQEKLYYAHCITMNRYKFSYGRKPKGERLKKLLLPECAPDFIFDYQVDHVIQEFQGVLEKI